MKVLDAAVGTIFETTVFLDYFSDLPDRRQAGKVTYPLDEIMFLSLLAVRAGAEASPTFARFTLCSALGTARRRT
jgi:hypothetical protein